MKTWCHSMDICQLMLNMVHVKVISSFSEGLLSSPRKQSSWKTQLLRNCIMGVFICWISSLLGKSMIRTKNRQEWSMWWSLKRSRYMDRQSLNVSERWSLLMIISIFWEEVEVSISSNQDTLRLMIRSWVYIRKVSNVLSSKMSWKSSNKRSRVLMEPRLSRKALISRLKRLSIICQEQMIKKLNLIITKILKISLSSSRMMLNPKTTVALSLENLMNF